MHRRVFGGGFSDAQVMARRRDPRIQDRIMRSALAGYRRALRSAGLDETTQNIYALHAFGPDTGTQILRTDPRTPLRNVVSSRIIRANPQWANMTVGQLIGSFR